jgi:hypothetical protein
MAPFATLLVRPSFPALPGIRQAQADPDAGLLLLLLPGCVGFELVRQAVPSCVQEEILAMISRGPQKWYCSGSRPAVLRCKQDTGRPSRDVGHRHDRLSMLTPSITDRSRKVFCCNDAQRQLRGGRCGVGAFRPSPCVACARRSAIPRLCRFGRYDSCPLRPSSTAPLLEALLPNGAHRV